MTIVDVFMEASVRALVLGFVAGLGLWLFRVRSAEVRHLVWTIVLGVAIALPPVTLAIPARPEALQVVVTIPDAVADRAVASLPENTVPNGASYAIAVYSAVAGFLLIRLLAGLWLTWRLAQRATPLAPGLCVSDELRSPVTFGSTILLPGNYDRWTADTLEAVLRHEGEHCARGDFYIQFAAKLYRAVYWFHPMAWYLHRQLADLAEQICDDAAVGAQDRTRYAEILVGFASKAQLSTECAVAMARMKAVSRRVERLLDAAFVPGKRLGAAGKWRVAALAAPVCILAIVTPVVLSAQKRGLSVAIVEGGSRGDMFVMNNDSADMPRIRKMRENAKGPIVWLSKDGKEYVSSDPAIIAQVKDMFKPADELGEEQAKLGEKQAALGELQANAMVAMPDMKAAMQRLTVKLAELEKRRNARIDELGDLEAALGDIHAKIGEAHAQIGARQGELGAKQAALGEMQARLGERQAELGERQAELFRKASIELEAMLDELVRQNKIRPAP